ncbi:hypothetical protein [Sphingobium yanoikuyae]|uniref:Uncharacterized protein n=1 Tax=Sphingobium yanoikuyae TaxID=13690 RepID=A0A3G2UTF2_SPHYA|nr:hypothetical protein [Sphingobium yanoikuyae]AYO78215.1 hypothetical protein EBF16_15775 [Sphingobium yanoikuyae]
MSGNDNLLWLDHLPVGWAQLYRDLLSDLAANGIAACVDEAKEKFGSLRIYLEPRVPAALPYIAAAEERSKVTCQKCGEPGELLMRNRIAATLCPVHGHGFSKPARPPVVTVCIKSVDISDE